MLLAQGIYSKGALVSISHYFYGIIMLYIQIMVRVKTRIEGISVEDALKFFND